MPSTDSTCDTITAGRRRENTATARVQPASVGNLLPGLLRIYLPNYTPHDVKISPGIQQLADKYTNMALETS